MHTLVRVDRWVIGLCLTIIVGSLVYALSASQLNPPIQGLGPPKYVQSDPGASTAVYYIDAISYSDLGIKLQIKGFRPVQGTSPNFFRRNKDETVFLYPGQLRLYRNRTVSWQPSPNVITLVYTVRGRDWRYFWHRYQRDLTRRRHP